MIVTHDNIDNFLYTPGKYLVIPDFQRPYSWDKANIISFIEDIESAISSGKNHYFGSMVFINEGNNKTIIDGQQRATTVLLMLTALYHITLDKPSSSELPAQAIKLNYLYNEHDYAGESNRIKLRTVTTDNEIFEQIFERNEFTTKSKDSKLYQAYAQFYSYFKDKSQLHIYITALKKFLVVSIALDASDDNPQKIFESINSTGKPLTDGDKIRNFALMLNDPNARRIVLKKYWELIEKNLTYINKDYISDFFKYYLTSRLQKDIKTDQVYPEFKKLFYLDIGESQSNIEKLENFYSQIIDYLNHYMFLKFNKDDHYAYKIVSDNGFRLNYLEIETPYPFLIRVLDEYKHDHIDNNELINIFKIIECYLARRIICNIQTTGLNKLFSTMHKDIKNYLSQYPQVNYSEILEYILINKSGGLKIPKESEIKYSIENNPIYSQKTNYVNFILSSVDDQSKESFLLKKIANGDNDLSIEHVMPQSLNKAWKEALGDNYEEIHSKHSDTLPNLTLTGYNSKYSNNDFNSKKTMKNGFNDSPLTINRFIRDCEEWNLVTLKKRESWWLDKIEKIWPLPTPLFKPAINETEFCLMDDIDVKGSKVKNVVILGESIACNTWAAALGIFLQKFFVLDEQLYDYVSSDNYLSKYIKSDKKILRSPNVIEGTPYHYENNINASRKRDIVVRLAEHLELEKSDIKVILAD